MSVFDLWEDWDKYDRAWEILRDYVYEDDDLEIFGRFYYFKGLPAPKLLEIAEILGDLPSSWSYEAEKNFLGAVELAKKYPDMVFYGVYKEYEEIKIEAFSLRI